MRNLALLLVLANLGVLAFFAWVVDEPEPPEPYDGPPIMLLREMDRGALEPPASPPEVLGGIRARAAGESGASDAGGDDAAGNDAAEGDVAGDDAGERDVAGDDTGEGVVGEPDTGEPDTGDVDTGEAAGEAGATGDAGSGEADPVAVENGQAPGRCISIGPFAEREEADAALATLVEAGFDPGRSIREAEVWEGYWVYIERLESVAAAREIERELAENGIDDTLVIASEENGILISLGVFSEIARAGSQAERVDALGYDATLSDSMRTTETHWLDVTLTSEESIALELLQEPGTISRLEQVACATDADAP